MSLRPNDRASRSRSKSGTRDRSRSRSNVRAPEAPEAPSPPHTTSYGYATKDPYGNGVASPQYEVRSPASAGAHQTSYFGQASAAPGANVPYPTDDAVYDTGPTMGGYQDLPPHERASYGSPTAQFPTMPDDDGLAYGGPMFPNGSHHQSHSNAYPPEPPSVPYPAQAPTYAYTPNAVTDKDIPNRYVYAQPPQDITYTSKPYTGASTEDVQYSQTAHSQSRELPRNYRQNSYDREYGADIIERTPGKGKPDKKASKSKNVRLSVDTRTPGAPEAPRSPSMPIRMGHLSVSGTQPSLSGLGGSRDLPPPSPLLEAYHGTYQQMSPMPMALSLDDDDELETLAPLSASATRSHPTASDRSAQDVSRSKEKKRVQVYDEEEDAKTISKALSHTTDAKAIVETLPRLSHDQIVYLIKAYKKQVKIQGKGVNLAKHLKTKLTGNFGKVAYVTALGRWESEGYWANFFYNSHSSRRELLIESLMGRTNGEIWNIKDEFRDKRYSDDLVKCMEKELKMDKFRTAVLMVLEERRQEEQDVYPEEYRNRDVDMLYKALMAKQGGESAMLEIVVRRSDSHLRDVMKTYERKYQENFPRAALKKSNNLVGEVITHILNGVINKPARDTLLLHHAIKDIADKNRGDEIRYELLISRLVRLHWDKQHLDKVKRDYLQRYKKHLEEDIDEATKGDFSDFMYALCSTKVR